MNYYSKITGGFYHEHIHGDNIPEDAIEISDDYYIELFEGQAQGKQIIADDNGYPVLIDTKDHAADIRHQRTLLLSSSDWTQLPDNKTSKEWKIYRQALRDITKQDGFPLSIIWPIAPDK